MEGHSRSGAFGEEVGQDSDDPFGRMRDFGGLGGAADMFSRPAWGGFTHGSSGDSWPMDDGMDSMESMRPRHRPKFSSASTMMGPRPFRRERRASGPSDQQQAAAADGNGGQARERIIPIQVERDEADSGAAASKQQPQQQTQQQAAQQQQTQPQPQQQQQQQQQQPRQQRPYVRRGTMDTPISTLQTEELQRDARARSAPPEAEPKATAARVPPLNVQAAAAASSPHKPNYFNSSPKPFSAQQRTFQTPSFGPQGQVPIPVQVERSGHQQQHPHQQQKQHHDQQQQQPQHPQHQQQEEETKQPPPPPPKPKSPKERAMEAIACVQERVAELGAEVEVFAGQRGEKQHLYLDEMLTRELIKLDNVEANGDDEIRTTRKQTIMSIQKCLAQLEAKLPKPGNTAAETEKAAEAEAPMETVEGQSAAEGAGLAVTGDAAAAEEVEMKPAGEAAQPPTAEAMETATAEVVPQEPAGAPADAPAVPGETSTPAPTPAQDSTPAASPEGDPTSATTPATGTTDPAPAPAPTEAVPTPVPTPASDPTPAAVVPETTNPAAPADQS